MTPDTERRRHSRHALSRPCKLYLPRSGKYVAGTTWDVSAGGVMLETHHAVGVEPGDRLFVGIAMKRRDALLRSRQMIETRAVRALTMSGGRTAVALEIAGTAAPTLARAA